MNSLNRKYLICFFLFFISSSFVFSQNKGWEEWMESDNRDRKKTEGYLVGYYKENCDRNSAAFTCLHQ